MPTKKVPNEIVDAVVLVDGHLDKGKPVDKGATVQVSQPVFDMFAKKNVLGAAPAK